MLIHHPLVQLCPAARQALSPQPHPTVCAPQLLPPLLITRPDGEPDTLPGVLWPELAAAASNDPRRPPLPSYSPIGIVPVGRREINRYLAAWKHPLGTYRRPFGEQHWLMVAGGEPIACASSSSTVSATVWKGTYQRIESVELARIASNPHPRALRHLRPAKRSLRVMLRAWTDWCAPLWEERYWSPHTAISYALPGTAGNLYRFDGWLKLGRVKPWGEPCGYSNASKADAIADGWKTLWVYPWLQPDKSGPIPPEHAARAARLERATR